MRVFAIILFLCLVGYACNSDAPPSDVVDEDTYISLLVELQLLQSYQKYEQRDSTAVDSLRRIIFKAYETTEQEFERSHRFYQDNIRSQRDRIGKAVEQLRKDRLSAQETTAATDTTG